jgi:hypothetical protein
LDRLNVLADNWLSSFGDKRIALVASNWYHIKSQVKKYSQWDDKTPYDTYYYGKQLIDLIRLWIAQKDFLGTP